MKLRQTTIILLFLFQLSGFANQIDIGIFESSSAPGQVDVKIRPDFNISSIETVTAILYTVRWTDPDVSLSVQYIFPFFLSPQGSPTEYNGYYYQTFASTPFSAVAMNAGEEYVVSSFTFTNGNCDNFELIEDAWTQSNNGDVYIEFLGSEVTGAIYQPNVSFGSLGGTISGNDTIIAGNSTGLMILSGINGSVIAWQRAVNDSQFTDIPATAGLTSYTETPPGVGTYAYRASIQEGSCPLAFSDTFNLEVIPPPAIVLDLKLFLEGCFTGAEMNTLLNQADLIPEDQPFSGYPWFYNGMESLPVNVSSDVVDWILIELRETNGGPATATATTEIGRKAALLLKNGTVRGSSETELSFAVNVNQDLYVVVWHRNHLAVMSSTSLTVNNNTYTYDYSSGESQIYGSISGKKEIATGIWGMAAGDGNRDGVINLSDTNDWQIEVGNQGYLGSDYNLDSQCNNTDKNDFWLLNINAESQIPE